MEAMAEVSLICAVDYKNLSMNSVKVMHRRADQRGSFSRRLDRVRRVHVLHSDLHQSGVVYI